MKKLTNPSYHLNFKRNEKNRTYLVCRGRAEPDERAHGVGALAEELVLLVARDLGGGERKKRGEQRKEETRE